MKELIQNAEDFMQSGDDNIRKKRFNVAVSDYFKAIVILCDYLIYMNIKALPKNHNERFVLLRIHFKDIYAKVSSLFSTYTSSYNLRLGEKEANELRAYANELKGIVSNKK